MCSIAISMSSSKTKTPNGIVFKKLDEILIAYVANAIWEARVRHFGRHIHVGHIGMWHVAWTRLNTYHKRFFLRDLICQDAARYARTREAY